MRLRTLESFWLLQNGLLHSYPSLQQNIQAGVVVLGGGITGALVSHALVENGYKVTLIDKRDIAAGSTAATTSMLQYEIDVPLHELAQMIGEEAAVTAYRAGIDAVHTLESLVNSLGIDAGFEAKQSLYIAHNKKAAGPLYTEYQMRNKHNLGVQWLEKEAIEKTYGLKSFGGILSATAGSVDAYKLAHALIKHNVGRGLQVYDQTEIKDFDFKAGDKVLLTTATGVQVQCSKVVFCTGYEATTLLKEKVANLFYTYATVSEQAIALPEALHHTLVWDTDEPYTYIRTTADGRLLAGGEDGATAFPFFQQKIKEAKSRRLQKKLGKLLPAVRFIGDFSWGGIFGTTHDGLPYMGESPEYNNALFVLGFGGNGITFSVQAMSIIIDLMQGKPNALAQLYRFGRRQ